MDNKTPTFILARSGRLRDGLFALLNAIPQIGPIHQVEGDLMELRTDSNKRQTLLVLDATMADKALWAYLKQAKRQKTYHQCKYVVLAENTFQQRMAWMAGADGVLLAGFPATQFFAVIEDVLGQTETPSEDVGGKSDANGTQQATQLDNAA